MPYLKNELLARLNSDILNCNNCALCPDKGQKVLGVGNLDAEIFFIGEAPGATEVKTGVPFSGKAGKMLDKILIKAGIEREKVFITNVLKCKTPANRQPKIQEIRNCLKHLLEQLKVIDPRVICTLGKIATSSLVDNKNSIGEIRGKVLMFENRFLLPTYHPSFVYYSKENQKKLLADFRKLKRISKNK